MTSTGRILPGCTYAKYFYINAKIYKFLLLPY